MSFPIRSMNGVDIIPPQKNHHHRKDESTDSYLEYTISTLSSTIDKLSDNKGTDVRHTKDIPVHHEYTGGGSKSGSKGKKQNYKTDYVSSILENISGVFYGDGSESTTSINSISWVKSGNKKKGSGILSSVISFYHGTE